MGLNIIAYRIIGVDHDEDFSGNKVKYLKTEPYKNFDSLRYAGDRDFVTDLAFENHDFEARYYRPHNIDLAIQWVEGTNKIPEANKPRLVKLLKDMEVDPSIYLVFSW